MEEIKQLTKLEIIDETIAYYSEDVSRRALDPITKHCRYRTKEGKMCAVGRCFDPNNSKVEWDHDSDIIGYSDCLPLESHLLPQYRGHEIGFWITLQEFHDNGNFWDDSELTQAGLDKVTRMRASYAD